LSHATLILTHVSLRFSHSSLIWIRDWKTGSSATLASGICLLLVWSKLAKLWLHHAPVKMDMMVEEAGSTPGWEEEQLLQHGPVI